MTVTEQPWQPTMAPGVLERRAQMLSRARAFFAARSILEVETPSLTEFGVTDPHIASLSTGLAGRNGRKYYLHTSPEFAMKRLLAAGAPNIFQICKVFRDHEIGRLHQPEFTLAEWYRRDFSFAEMIDETCVFIREICPLTSSAINQQHYRDAFQAACTLDPVSATPEQLLNCAQTLVKNGPADIFAADTFDRDGVLDLLMSHVIIPNLPDQTLTVIHHYPASQAALARLDPGNPNYAERFEIFFGTVELANGYRELTDPAEHRRRFDIDKAGRQSAGQPCMESDELLLAALAAGLPECSGVAVGFDRLVMIAGNLEHIDQALSFALK